MGPPGADGSDGTDGLDGPPGATGAGATGATGATGALGATGATGVGPGFGFAQQNWVSLVDGVSPLVPHADHQHTAFPSPDMFVVYAVDQDGVVLPGNDTTGQPGTSIYQATPALDMSNALAFAVATPYKTLEQVGRQLPREGNNATLVVLIRPRIGGATYKKIDGVSDQDMGWMSQLTGWKRVLIRATNTFLNDTADKVACGFQTVASTFAGGYNALAGSTPSTLNCQKQGGAAAGFPAEAGGSSAISGKRIRFTSGALINQTAMIWKNTTTQLVLSNALTGVPNPADNFLIEEPGLHVGNFTHSVNHNGSAVALAGFGSTIGSATVYGPGGINYAGSESSGDISFTGLSTATLTRSYTDELGNDVVVGVSLRAASNVSASHIGDLTHASGYTHVRTAISNSVSLNVGAGCVYRKGGSIQAGAGSSKYGGAGNAAYIAGSQNVAGTQKLRVTQALIADGFTGAFELQGISGSLVYGIDFANCTVPLIDFKSSGAVFDVDGITSLDGGNTNTVLNLTSGSNQTIAVGLIAAEMTAAAALGDIRMAGLEIAPFTLLIDANYVDTVGNNVYGQGGIVICNDVVQSNVSAGTIAAYSVLRVTGNNQVALAQAPANIDAFGVAQMASSSGNTVLTAVAGPVPMLFNAPNPTPGNIAYLSTTAGQAQDTFVNNSVRLGRIIGQLNGSVGLVALDIDLQTVFTPAPASAMVALVDYDAVIANGTGGFGVASDVTGRFGYAPSTGVLTTDIQTALNSAMLTPFKTLEQVGKSFPRGAGNGSNLRIFIRPRIGSAPYRNIANTADQNGVDWLSGISGWNSVVIRGSLNLTNTQEDVTTAGYYPTAGTNPGGYNVTASTVGGTSYTTCQLNGGGAPGFTAESGGWSVLLGKRIRWSATTTTPALRNTTSVINEVLTNVGLVPSNQIFVTPVASDVFFIESPGVVVGNLTHFAGVNGSMSLTGFGTTTALQTLSNEGPATYNGITVSGVGFMAITGANSGSISLNALDYNGTAGNDITIGQATNVIIQNSAYRNVRMRITSPATRVTFGSGCVISGPFENLATIDNRMFTVGGQFIPTAAPLRYTQFVYVTGQAAMNLCGGGGNIGGVRIDNCTAGVSWGLINFQGIPFANAPTGEPSGVWAIDGLTGSGNTGFILNSGHTGTARNAGSDFTVAWAGLQPNTITANPPVGTLPANSVSWGNCQTSLAPLQHTNVYLSGCNLTTSGIGTVFKDVIRTTIHSTAVDTDIALFRVVRNAPVNSLTYYNANAVPASADLLVNCTGITGVSISDGGYVGQDVIVATDGVVPIEFTAIPAYTDVGQPVWLSALTGANAGKVQTTPGTVPVMIGTLYECYGTTIGRVKLNALQPQSTLIGATGVAGAAGAPGAAGATGATGAGGVGSQGATGATGTAGAAGTQGATGATGVMGATGANGPITLATFAIGYESTVGVQILTGITYGLPPYTITTPFGFAIQWRVPQNLSNIEVWVETDSIIDLGAAGSFTIELLKNGVPSGAGNVINSIGATTLVGGPIAYVAGDRYGFNVTGGGTVGVSVSFTLFARGIP
jgi:hypothetical protein